MELTMPTYNFPFFGLNSTELLETIAEIEKSEDKAKILMQTSSNGMNPLMWAAQNFPNAVEPLLAIIAKLEPKEDRAKILMQVDNNGDNALMWVAYIPSTNAVEPLLAAIATLEKPEDRAKILMQTNKDNELNSTMISAYYHPQNLKPLLMAAPESLQVEILTQRLKKSADKALVSGDNALQIALIKGQSKGVEDILSVVSGWEKLNQVFLFEQVNVNKHNALMLAISNNQLLTLILTAVKGLPSNTIETLFTQQNYRGHNIIKMILDEHPEQLPQILRFITTLKPSSQTKILKNMVGKVCEKIMTEALNSHSESNLQDMQKLLLQIPTESLIELYNSKVLSKLTGTIQDTGRKRVLLELIMTTNLAVLSSKIDGLRDVNIGKEDNNSPYNTAKKLYDDVAASWSSYQSGSNDEKSGQIFKDKLNQAINAARPVLSRLEDGIGILNMLIRLVKTLVNCLPFIAWETNSEKEFKSLEEHAEKYTPRVKFFQPSTPASDAPKPSAPDEPELPPPPAYEPPV